LGSGSHSLTRTCDVQQHGGQGEQARDGHAPGIHATQWPQSICSENACHNPMAPYSHGSVGFVHVRDQAAPSCWPVGAVAQPVRVVSRVQPKLGCVAGEVEVLDFGDGARPYQPAVHQGTEATSILAFV
jgi:hypothetical protein